MEDEKEDIWKASKVIEEDESGELRLLQANLDKLQGYLQLNECDVADLNIISVIGAHDNENAFLTNLLAVYLKKNGMGSWSNSLSKEGLGGFAFGTIVENKEEITSSENSKEENLLQRADCDNHQHSFNEENTRQVDEEIKEDALDDVCKSVSEINLENDHPQNLNPQDENDNTQESPALENLKAGFSEMNLQQRIEIYKIVSKLIMQAGKLPQTCGDDVSNASGALFSAAQMFDGILMNSEDDMESGVEDFVMIDRANPYSPKIENFVACSEMLIKESERILSERCMKQSEPNQRMNGIKTDTKYEFVEQDTDSELMNSNNSIEKGNNGQHEGDNSPEKDNNGPQESDIPSVKENNGPPESDHSPEKDNNRAPVSEHLQDNNEQEVCINLPEKSNEQLENDDLREQGKIGQFTINNSQENYDEQVKNDTSENDNNEKVDSSTGQEKLISSNVKGSIEPEKETTEHKYSEGQTETKAQNDVTMGQADMNANQQTEGNDVNEICFHQDDPDNRKKQSMISSNLFPPDENKSGIYVYPEIISSENEGRQIKWCILHLHKKSSNDLTEHEPKLEQFLLDVCTRIVRISDNKTTVSAASQCNAALVNDKFLDPQLYQKIFNIVTVENQENIISQLTTEQPKTFHSAKDTLRIDHDGSGRFNLSSKHLRVLSCLLKNITEYQIDDVRKEKKTKQVKHTNFEQYITHKFKNINRSSGLLDRGKSDKDKDKYIRPLLPMEQDQGNTDPLPPLPDTNRAQNNGNDDASMTVKFKALKLSKTSEHPEDKVIEETSLKYLRKIEKRFAVWIEKELGMGNIRTILSLYETWLADVIKKISKTRGMEKVDLNKIEESMKQRANEKCKPVIDDVVANMEKFCIYFCGQFEKHNFFQFEEMETILETRKIKMLTSSSTEEAIKLMSLGYDKLAGILRKYNKQRANAEKNISMEIKHKIRNVYASKLELLLASKIPLDPETFGQFHVSLTANLLEAYEKCYDNISKAEDKEKLCHNLLTDFQDFFERNMLLLELSQKKVKGFIGKSKSGYEEIMDNLLKQNKCGINPKDFEMTHTEESFKAENFLKLSIHTDDELDEPLEKHMITLKKHIEKSYKTFKEDNEDFLEKNQKFEKIAKRDNSVSAKGSKTSNQKNPRNLSSDLENQLIGNQRSREPAPKKIKMELPPLLIQLTLSKIGIATMPTDSWESNSGTINIQTHSGEVGILMDETWVCGDDVKELNHQGKVQKFWSFEVIFNSYDYNDTVVINKEEILITLPFLMGIFFGLMRQRAEKKHNGIISTAMISVPFWFSSDKRRQVVEAGTIAGFDKVQLVNENTASAYFAYANSLSSPAQKMVVISENSTRVDISIYSYDQQSKKISMRGQSGDYETAELSKQKGFIQKFVTGILKYVFNNQQEKGIQKKALESLDKLWALAKSRVENHLNLNYKTVLICCESDYWREFLWQFATNITSSDNISVRNDSPLLGLASFFHTSVTTRVSSVELLFRDAIPFNLILSQGNEHLVVPIKNPTFSKYSTQDFNFGIPSSVGYHNFSENDLSSQRFGKFKLKSKPPHHYNIKIVLKRDKNGMFVLTGVDYTEGGSYDWGVPKKSLPDCYYEWEPCKTTDEKLATYSSLMDQINLKMQSSSDVDDILKPTEEKAVKIKEAVQACTDKFKSSIGKNMVIRQIDDIIEALKQPGIQGQLLKKHATYLDSIVLKYSLEI